MKRKNRDLVWILVALAVGSVVALSGNGFWLALNLRLQMANGITLRTATREGLGELTLHGSDYYWCYGTSTDYNPSFFKPSRWTTQGFTNTFTTGTVTFVAGRLTLQAALPVKKASSG